MAKLLPDSIVLEIERLPHAEGLPLPEYHSTHAAGMDLAAAVIDTVTIEPGHWVMIPTGLAIRLPDAYEAQVRPRSGLAARHGVTLLNAPGTIDADYRGEIQVIMINHGPAPFAVERGMRIAQMVIAPVTRVVGFEEVTTLPTSLRGTGGFGSTGFGSPESGTETGMP